MTRENKAQDATFGGYQWPYAWSRPEGWPATLPAPSGACCMRSCSRTARRSTKLGEFRQYRKTEIKRRGNREQRRRKGDRKGITKRFREEKEKEEDEPCAKERRSWSCFGGSGGERQKRGEKGRLFVLLTRVFLVLSIRFLFHKFITLTQTNSMQYI